MDDKIFKDNNIILEDHENLHLDDPIFEEYIQTGIYPTKYGDPNCKICGWHDPLQRNCLLVGKYYDKYELIRSEKTEIPKELLELFNIKVDKPLYITYEYIVHWKLYLGKPISYNDLNLYRIRPKRDEILTFRTDLIIPNELIPFYSLLLKILKFGDNSRPYYMRISDEEKENTRFVQHENVISGHMYTHFFRKN